MDHSLLSNSYNKVGLEKSPYGLSVLISFADLVKGHTCL